MQPVIGSPTRFQVCTRCVMDTSDPEIAFDHEGVCNHCRRVAALARSDHWQPDSRGSETIRRSTR